MRPQERVNEPACFHQKPTGHRQARIAGKLAADVLHMIAPHVKAGVTTDELDRLCNEYIVNVQNTIPANIGYHGFPKTVCTSVNHVICHGIPSDKVLRNGDIINIDVAIIKDAGTVIPAACILWVSPGRWPGALCIQPMKPWWPVSVRCVLAPHWAMSATPYRM
ncbi:peptidase M24A [Advenella kashmirensis WT001]|uniref:Peptidase M24A n=1 Tax=Advenella kashmirensis (strain DSM 17095 / LMG 22695 / WT001) TaxID=1036672 RepID=I3U7G7_ADVKW|nr:peptidase M24A [Advenella kashmirensis WT001]